MSGDDMPLYAHPEEIGKAAIPQLRNVQHNLNRAGFKSPRHRIGGAADAIESAQRGRMSAGPGVSRFPRSMRGESEYVIGKGLIPTMGQLKTAGQTVKVNAQVAGALAKPKLQQGWKAATATPGRAVATGAGAGFVGAAAIPNRQPRQQTYNYFGKAREYDYDRNRNRRLGAAEAGLVLGGGYAGWRGVEGVREETRAMRNAKIRTSVGGKDKSVGEIWGRRALAINRRNALLLGGGAGAITAAGAIHAHGNSNKGRVYR